MKARDIAIIVAMVALAVGFTYFSKNKMIKQNDKKPAQTEQAPATGQASQAGAANPHAGMPVDGMPDQDLFKQWIVVSLQEADVKKIADKKNEMVATVNGEGIKRADFERRLEMRLKVMKSSSMHGEPLKEKDLNDAKRKEIEGQLLDSMIEEKFVELEANKRGVGISDKDFEAAMAARIAQIGGQKKFDELLSGHGITEEQMRTNLRREMVMQNLAEKVLPDLKNSAKKAM